MSKYGDDADITGSLIVDGAVDLGSGDDDIDMDVGTLFVSASNDRVGIGTDTSNDPTPHTLYTIAAIGCSNGSGGAGTDFFDGAIGEILCFTGSPLSDEEVRTIEKYLVYKWSLEDHYRT